MIVRLVVLLSIVFENFVCFISSNWLISMLLVVCRLLVKL